MCLHWNCFHHATIAWKMTNMTCFCFDKNIRKLSAVSNIVQFFFLRPRTALCHTHTTLHMHGLFFFIVSRPDQSLFVILSVPFVLHVFWGWQGRGVGKYWGHADCLQAARQTKKCHQPVTKLFKFYFILYLANKFVETFLFLTKVLFCQIYIYARSIETLK